MNLVINRKPRPHLPLTLIVPRGGGGGGFTPIEGRTRCARRKTRKTVSKSGVGAERADREKGVQIAKMGGGGGEGIQIAMIRVQVMRLYVERMSN